jgi:putative membrane protein
MTDDPTQDVRAPLDTGTRLAFERTYLAHERTQMAWVRTGLALISFGFGIAKFFQYLYESKASAAPALGPRTVGMVMISIGLGSLVVANVQHRRALKTLRAQCPGLPLSTAGMTASVIMLLGILALVSAWIRN